MPGVYRDSNGTYTYQTTNDYEDRRRRALDDARAGRTPFGPRPPDTRPPITWNPFPAPVADNPQLPPAPPAPANASGLEILIAAAEAAQRVENDALFDRLVSVLPNKVGESPAFDRMFDNPNTPKVTAIGVIEQLIADGRW